MKQNNVDLHVLNDEFFASATSRSIKSVPYDKVKQKKPTTIGLVVARLRKPAIGSLFHSQR